MENVEFAPPCLYRKTPQTKKDDSGARLRWYPGVHERGGELCAVGDVQWLRGGLLQSLQALPTHLQRGNYASNLLLWKNHAVEPFSRLPHGTDVQPRPKLHKVPEASTGTTTSAAAAAYFSLFSAF